MKRCYKCQAPYLDPTGPKFNELCEGCGSYLHCCQNCHSYNEFSRTRCNEPDAEYVSDPNGLNRCELFSFKHWDTSGMKLDEREDRPGMRLRPDWRNLQKKGEAPKSPEEKDRARKARDALEKLFKPSASPKGPEKP